jgi:hypothetical protein
MCLGAFLPRLFMEILTGEQEPEIWIVQTNYLTFATAKDDRRER